MSDSPQPFGHVPDGVALIVLLCRCRERRGFHSQPAGTKHTKMPSTERNEGRTRVSQIGPRCFFPARVTALYQSYPGAFCKGIGAGRGGGPSPVRSGGTTLANIPCRRGRLPVELVGRLPDSVVAAAAHHHHPQRGPQDRLDSTAVVYVANLLAIERGAAEKGGASPAFDMEYLSLCGAADHLEEWRRLADEVQPHGPLLVG